MIVLIKEELTDNILQALDLPGSLSRTPFDFVQGKLTVVDTKAPAFFLDPCVELTLSWLRRAGRDAFQNRDAEPYAVACGDAGPW